MDSSAPLNAGADVPPIAKNRVHRCCIIVKDVTEVFYGSMLKKGTGAGCRAKAGRLPS
jgi:hypothetical protein